MMKSEELDALYQGRFVATRASDPTVEYENEVKACQRYLPAKYVIDSPFPEKVDVNAIRLVCISDTHSQHEKMTDLPQGDILVHAGDFTTLGKAEEITKFAQWFRDIPGFKHKVLIAGNHDQILDSERCEVKQLYSNHFEIKQQFIKTLQEDNTIVYLEDNGIELLGLRFWGSPWQPEFCDWAFNLGRGQPCLNKWQLIPNDIDVLITHGPPLGRGDLCYDKKRAGCRDLLEQIQNRIRPKVHIFGHIHEDHSTSSDGVTDYVNPSSCTLFYRPTQAPIVLDLSTSSIFFIFG